jgi:hypothetical protein
MRKPKSKITCSVGEINFQKRGGTFFTAKFPTLQLTSSELSEQSLIPLQRCTIGMQSPLSQLKFSMQELRLACTFIVSLGEHL